MQTINISELDVVFISYDEPNAEYNWADLLRKIPWAQRVHGVKGSDAAHKAAARLVSTERFITIDGDNVIEESFVDQVVNIENSVDLSRSVISWPAINSINSLVYGNGGIKCWPKQLVLDMRTHESAPPENIRAQVDFCWDINYIPLDSCYSKIANNASPKQAWRAGFREGVKMCLDDGIKVQHSSQIPVGNLNRLLMWMTVGADVENGEWAMLGARMGCDFIINRNWDYIQVRDFDELEKIWNQLNVDLQKDTSTPMSVRISTMIFQLSQSLKPFVAVPPSFDARHSEFFKRFKINPDRQPSYISTHNTKYDIVMITYGENNAEANWLDLKTRFPRAKRVDMVKGIHQAHIEAAKLVSTEMFWVVDGDARITEDFNFSYVAPVADLGTVHVWRSQNPVNGLVYGYGGVKLLPRLATLNMDVSKPDMTTSISPKYKAVKILSNITQYDTDEFSVWRSAFRECCKLSSKVIDRQVSAETDERLSVWTSRVTDHPFIEASLNGAREGMRYGKEWTGDVDALGKINDYSWLKNKFEEMYDK